MPADDQNPNSEGGAPSFGNVRATFTPLPVDSARIRAQGMRA
jgi:hypothetical protein